MACTCKPHLGVEVSKLHTTLWKQLEAKLDCGWGCKGGVHLSYFGSEVLKANKWLKV